MRRLPILCLVLLPVLLKAQFTYVLDETIPVLDQNGNMKAMPWAGGLNAAQYNTMDVNMDGVDDLVLFDRMSNSIIPFVKIEGGYRRALEYAHFFPSDILNFILLRDYNCDGKKDLFTGDNLGIKVYTNVSTGNVPAWKQFLFSSGFGSKSTVLLSKGFTNKVNVIIQYDDLPAIEDVDNDGDLDLLTMRFVGNGNLELHLNYSKERYGTCDSLEFERATQTYGNVRECSCGQFAFNGADCTPVSGGRTQHAGGKSLLLIDVNGDQNKEVLISEATCSQLYRLQNEGTGINPVFNTSSTFPAATPASIVVYPTAYFEDVDADNKKDLIITPNAFVKDLMNMDLVQSNWFYKNTGSTTAPNFVFQQRNFLQDQMIDVGDNAIPAFVDMDGDGDEDMFISNNFFQGYISKIAAYENIGTTTSPSFKLLTDDFLALSTFVQQYNRKIQFTDIDNNNTIDLVYTATGFESGITSVFYVQNKSQNVLDFSGQMVMQMNVSLDKDDNVFFVDLSGDGLKDILVGRSNGSIDYWKQTGGFQFVVEKQGFAGYGVSVLRQSPSMTIADLDADGRQDLIVGDQSGSLQILSDFKNAVDNSGAVVDLIFNPLLPEEENQFIKMNLGGRIWPTVTNLFNGAKPSIVVGTVLGGVSVLRHNDSGELPSQPRVDVYPNPVLEDKLINITTDRAAIFHVVSLTGAEISSPVILHGFETYQYNTTKLAPGLYVFRFIIDGRTYAKKVAIP